MKIVQVIPILKYDDAQELFNQCLFYLSSRKY